MKIGVPKEIRVLEGRVGLIPAAAGQLVEQGHEVLVEAGAGRLSGYPDQAYADLGVTLMDTAAAVYDAAEIIVKVKEPQPVEVAMLRKDQLLFSYLHLAADLDLLRALQASGVTAVAFETVETDAGRLPLLAPMSDIAGRVAVQVGAHLLHQPQGGGGHPAGWGARRRARPSGGVGGRGGGGQCRVTGRRDGGRGHGV